MVKNNTSYLDRIEEVYDSFEKRIKKILIVTGISKRVITRM